ncbi:MAG: transposase [Leptospirales bacterium]
MGQEPRREPSLFSWVVQRHIDPEHPLMLLAGKIDWKGIDAALAPYYARSGTGRPPKPTRLMVGLMILKHRLNLSDAEVVQGLHENVVWMVFCGVPPEEAHFVESSTLCKFRKRLGPEGSEKVEALVREQLRKDKRIAPSMRVDTTAMEKHIAYPTDAGLLQKGRVRLTRLVEKVTEESRVLERVMTQTVNRIRERPVEDKRIYSTHEPHVTCITKNKAGKKHEYGVKVSLSVDANGFVVTHREYPDNRHDSTTLGDALEDWVKATGSLPKMLAADRGYRSKEEREPDLLDHVPKVAIPRKGKIQGPNEQSSWFKRLTARRAGLEAIISHLKTDHRMNRSRYKGLAGDHLNVSWAAIAWNTKKWVEGCRT